MEQSRTEQYLARLQKWKEEKAKGKKTVSRVSNVLASKPPVNNSCKSPKVSCAKPVPALCNNVVTKSSNLHGKQIEHLKTLNREKQKGEKQGVPEVSQGTTKVCTPKVVLDTAAENPAKSLKPKFKVVQSRLFDYKNKDPNTENRPTRDIRHKVTKAVPKLAPVAVKKGLKRRFSEAGHDNSPTKRCSILKRKSCFGSFGYQIKDVNISSNGDKMESSKQINGLVAKEDNVIMGNGNVEGTVVTELPEVLSTTANTTSPSKKKVQFTTPPLNGGHESGKKLRKTPKAPTEKSPALNSSQQSSGRTPSKLRHLMCHPHDHTSDGTVQYNTSQTKRSLSLSELSEQMNVLEEESKLTNEKEKMNKMLDECMVLLESDCPVEVILPCLDDIYKSISYARTSARYYTCKANVLKSALDLDVMLQIFEDAINNDAQPKEEIGKSLKETLKFVMDGKVKEAAKQFRTRRPEVQKENVFESSKVVYAVSNVTPFSESKMSRKKAVSTPGMCQIVTPVRRSTRRSLLNVPDSLQDKRPCFSSISEVDQQENLIFHPNLALNILMQTMEEECQ